MRNLNFSSFFLLVIILASGLVQDSIAETCPGGSIREPCSENEGCPEGYNIELGPVTKGSQSCQCVRPLTPEEQANQRACICNQFINSCTEDDLFECIVDITVCPKSIQQEICSGQKGFTKSAGVCKPSDPTHSVIHPEKARDWIESTCKKIDGYCRKITRKSRGNVHYRKISFSQCVAVSNKNCKLIFSGKY
ncbi:uncharacterized protein LOC110860449 [Folsomia candida]|uniref:uncharacterized protein LOC110860449 n=1 Tax=Folsomia candida TaxID=158441 RepID=UPI000B8FD5D4|nr:uncharacterized protein LOC110860449 [Folsomia candida]